MNISGCIIVKDDSEALKLRRALDSLVPWVRNCYVTSTGKETKLIEELCKEKNVHHSHFDWVEDFSAVRTFNFSQVDPRTDYILWIDSDDCLVGGQYLQEIAEMGVKYQKDVIFFEYWYACRFKGEPSVENIDNVELVHHRERLIRPGTIKWVGRLHETPVPLDGSRQSYTSITYSQTYETQKLFPIAVAHMAEAEGLLEKMDRNKRLLELQLDEERMREVGADPRTLLYLMKIYAELDDPKIWDECLKMGEEYLTKSGWDEERGTCWELMGQVWGRKNEPKKAAEAFHNAIREWPHNVLYYVRLASTYYNLKDFKACKHWLDVGSKMDLDKRYTSGMINYHAIKSMFADLIIKLNYNVDKDINKAYEAAALLYKEVPSEENLKQFTFLESSKRLNDACKDLDDLTKYLHDIGEDQRIVPILDVVPQVIQDMPFAQNLRKKFTPPRYWDDNEICIFANFNQPHFNKWDTTSLKEGIGGSETAVIMLANEWAKLGYRVTVYGDPYKMGDQTPEGAYGRVIYLPWYYFNIKDKFNIFIQWRGWQLAQMIKCRRFYVDLHDIYSAVDLSGNQLNNIDKLFVKSEYHRGLAPTVQDDKFMIVPHGI